MLCDWCVYCCVLEINWILPGSIISTIAPFVVGIDVDISYHICHDISRFSWYRFRFLQCTTNNRSVIRGQGWMHKTSIGTVTVYVRTVSTGLVLKKSTRKKISLIFLGKNMLSAYSVPTLTPSSGWPVTIHCDYSIINMLCRENSFSGTTIRMRSTRKCAFPPGQNTKASLSPMHCFLWEGRYCTNNSIGICHARSSSCQRVRQES